ncbi:tetraacyldisaccharide 4'-kinase [Basfia succiniciproducens]|uniref:tetraacyldisaccharide 4'-kinase n=1 Tax=Basfia succiniciproducens TaxID=653940 RepID=UPI0008D6D269|nr:tetraacyldisaccharide 4'-kinase [Basfia succiniciproducens]SEP95335.1 lipid-A-disaccharide kinase [Basfia succiniciproducens]
MKFWYTESWIAYLLLPFSCLFWLMSQCRRWLFQAGIIKSYRAPVPIVIVGNLSVGGNGKTPVVIWLVKALQQKGLRVGVISRGYGSQSAVYPLLVTEKTDPLEGGDEPVLIAQRTQVPVCISANRQQAIELLLQTQPCDVIVSDDGLQHYKLQRDFEIVVVDAQRGFGNGFVMPAGPLRELPSRLDSVDLVIANGKANRYSQTVMTLAADYAVNLVTKEKRLLTEFESGSAFAGIGNPQRFFTMLQGFGIQLKQTYEFQDHQKFSAELFAKFSKNEPHFMTEKDAVKCFPFARENWWYVPVEAKITGQSAVNFIENIVERVKNGQ